VFSGKVEGGTGAGKKGEKNIRMKTKRKEKRKTKHPITNGNKKVTRKKPWTDIQEKKY